MISQHDQQFWIAKIFLAMYKYQEYYNQYQFQFQYQYLLICWCVVCVCGISISYILRDVVVCVVASSFLSSAHQQMMMSLTSYSLYFLLSYRTIMVSWYPHGDTIIILLFTTTTIVCSYIYTQVVHFLSFRYFFKWIFLVRKHTVIVFQYVFVLKISIFYCG